MASVALLPSVEFEVATVTPVVAVEIKVEPVLFVLPVAEAPAAPRALAPTVILYPPDGTTRA